MREEMSIVSNDNDEEMIRKLRRMNKEDAARNPQNVQHIRYQGGRGKGGGCRVWSLVLLGGLGSLVWAVAEAMGRLMT